MVLNNFSSTILSLFSIVSSTVAVSFFSSDRDSSFSSDRETLDENNVKVAVKEKLKNNEFSQAIDFFRKEEKNYEYFYHHVGIYAFTNKALVRYVSLKRSKLELERKLEQMRALEK